MKINDILLESFSDAKRIFSQDEDKETVTKYLDTFKDLAKRNVVKGQEKDIGKWIKAGWEDFKAFVDSNKDTYTKSEVKKRKAHSSNDSITAYEDSEKMVVIPLTKNASCFYGKNTSWCTSVVSYKNRFVEYFYEKSTTLFYVIKDGKKYAATMRPKRYSNDHDYAFYDENDESMSGDNFTNETGVKVANLNEWKNKFNARIEEMRNLNNLSDSQLISILEGDIRIIKHIDKPSEEVLIAAAEMDGYVLIENIADLSSLSEKVKIEAVKSKPQSIILMKQLKINISDNVKAAAIKVQPRIIERLGDLSERLQSLAVEIDYTSAQFIENPSQDIQNIIISKKSPLDLGNLQDFSVESIIKVSEWFWPIVGIVNDHGFNDGVVPEEAQVNAVKQNASAIKKISNPTEKVLKLHKELWGE